MNDAYLTILQSIDNNTTVITPNRRLSATLHKAYQQYQLILKNTHWQTPDILPATSWIERLWRNHTSTECQNFPLLLNAAQDQFVWEGILLKAKESAQIR